MTPTIPPSELEVLSRMWSSIVNAERQFYPIIRYIAERDQVNLKRYEFDPSTMSFVEKPDDASSP